MRKGLSVIKTASWVLVLITATVLSSGALAFERVNATVTSLDGTEIELFVLTPDNDDPQKVYPTVILVSPWMFSAKKYYVQAVRMVERGFLVFGISSRGFGGSGGYINMGGQKDSEDVSAAIDWLLENTQADPENIGATGFSYGAGISLNAAAKDGRIKTVSAMSSWTDFGRAMFGNDTPRKTWPNILEWNGSLMGNMDPSLVEDFRLLETNELEESYRDEMFRQRSVARFIDDVNDLGIPIYFQHGLRDDLFRPNQIVDFYEQLETPKKLDMTLDVHVSAELPGLVLPNVRAWNRTIRWFEYWLKGIDNGIMDEDPVRIPVLFTGPFRTKYHSFDAWPPEELQSKTYYLHGRGRRLSGSLEVKPDTKRSEDVVENVVRSGSGIGMAAVSSALEATVRFPVKSSVFWMKRDCAARYETPRMKKQMRIVGTPTLDVWIEPSGEEAQVIGYLYDVDWFGTTTLVTYGPVTVWDAVPGEAMRVSLDMQFVAYDLKRGHKLALVIDTQEAMYTPPTDEDYTVTLPFGAGYDSVLTVPFVE